MCVFVVYVGGHIELNASKSEALFWVFNGGFKSGFWIKFLNAETLNTFFVNGVRARNQSLEAN